MGGRSRQQTVTQPLPDGRNTEDALDHELWADLRETAVPDGAWGNDAKERTFGEALEVCRGEEVRKDEKKTGAEAARATVVTRQQGYRKPDSR